MTEKENSHPQAQNSPKIPGDFLSAVCKNCGTQFEITDQDQDFYKRMEVSEPTFCPDCRRQRRLIFRNERNLYIRNCDFSGKQMITVYSPDKPVKVYHHDIWWSDKWDAKEYGMDFDFTKTFSEQFWVLQSKVPRMSMIITTCENSDYAPYSVNSKNCYMCVSSNFSEDVMYCYQTNSSKDCLDCTLSYHCELCYECVFCVKLYHAFWSINCNNCSDIYFCRDCQGCRNCIGCVSLINKSFHIFNQPVSKEEFNKTIETLKNRENILKQAKAFEEFSSKMPFRAVYTIGSENISGNHIINSKNSHYCFEVEGLEDCKYIHTIPLNAKDCYDCHYTQNGELCLDSISAVNDYNCKFVLHSWNVKNSSYVQECYYSSNLFGCLGLKQSKYCILNKQYPEKEYEELLPKIIEHMKKTGEWGEYFHPKLSLFAYNESLAQEFFPLPKEEVIKNGNFWKEKDEREYQPANHQMPDNIDKIDDNVIGKILACTDCGKNYKIIFQELNFYRKNGIPAPAKCPDCRHKNRIKIRGAHHLWDGKCDKCGENTKSEHDPTIPKIVYCEKCYLETII